MNKNCTLCGNIYYNTVFKGGYVCEDCIAYIKQVDLEDLSSVKV